MEAINLDEIPPCETCPVLAICINKSDPKELIPKCSILLKYMRDGRERQLRIERFYKACEVLKIKVRKNGGFIVMEKKDGSTNEVPM